MRIKTKLNLVTGFLFIVMVIFGILSLLSVNRLKTDSAKILKNNYETLVYCNAMQEAMDRIGDNPRYLDTFYHNLQLQAENITEPGEQQATDQVMGDFSLLKMQPGNDSLKKQIRASLHQINELNQQAILRKNISAASRAEQARNWLVVIFTVLVIITFTLSFNFPGVIHRPVLALMEGIGAVVKKDYSKRIYLKGNDEFSELASAFNQMAEKLDEYEHSSLAKIKFEKSRIETIINQMHDGIIGLDDYQQILFVNRVAEKLLGLKQEDIAGKYAPDVAVKNDLMRTMLQDESRQQELKIFADNRESYFQPDTFTVYDQQVSVGKVIILRNITPFHELSDAKTNFMATVSHELKTPIASIKISTQLLNDSRVGTVNAEQKDLIESISNDAGRLLKITSELLNMSQVETGHIQLSMEPTSTSEIFELAARSVQSMLAEKNITLSRDIPTGLPDVLADRDKASWVLTNFLTNAIKHSAPSSAIELIAQERSGFVRFQVRDYGKGIEQKYLDRIFDRYYKVPESLSAGNGLGLAIAKEFIEAQSGSIGVETKPAEGSTFYFELPRVPISR